MRARFVRWSSSRAPSSFQGQRFDAVVVGGGHNGLVAVSYGPDCGCSLCPILTHVLAKILQAGYLAKAGRSVAVLERRRVLGGAAVTEEIVPGIYGITIVSVSRVYVICLGFRFSRASYLLSLLRPQIVKDLELKVALFLPLLCRACRLLCAISQKHGLKVYLRDPNAFAPVLGSEQYLLLGSDPEQNRRQIAKFSQRDAEVCVYYTDQVG